MKVNQRDIVEVSFYTGRTAEIHPAIVVSNYGILEAEGFFYAVLLSTKNHFPEYTLEITPEMINKPRNQNKGYAVCHMIQLYTPDQIISRTGSTLKKEVFLKVIEKITNVIFSS